MRNLLVRDMLDIHLLLRVFNSHTDKVAIFVEFDQDVLIEISCLSNFFIDEVYRRVSVSGKYLISIMYPH